MHVPKEKNWHGIANFEHCAAVRHHPYKKPHKRFGHSTNICLAIYISICISPWKWQFQIDCSVTIVHCTSSAKYNFSWMIKDRKDWYLIEIRDIKRKNSLSHVFQITFLEGVGGGSWEQILYSLVTIFAKSTRNNTTEVLHKHDTWPQLPSWD